MAHINGKYGNTDTDRHIKDPGVSWLTNSTRPGSGGLNSLFRRTKNLGTSDRFRNDFWSLAYAAFENR